MKFEGGDGTAPDPNAKLPTPGKTSKNKFTKEEDEILVRLVNQLGTSHWEAIAAQIPGRSARQCRDSWNHYLTPNINQMPWTIEEDRRLLTLYQMIGAHWAKIGEKFSGRTSVSVKNRWRRLHRQQLKLARTQPVLAGVLPMGVMNV